MSKPKHILVIRLSALGDIAMTVPVLRVFTQTYPEVKVTVLTKAFFEPLFQDIPNVSVLTADVYGKHKGLGILKLANEARSLKVDGVADLHNVIRSKIISAYLKFFRIRTKSLDKGRNEKKKLVNAAGKTIRPLKSMHERYADVFRELGFNISLDQHKFPERKQLNSRLNTLIGPHYKKIVGIAPFAAFKGKMYPIESTIAVMQALDKRSDLHVFLFGGGQKEIDLLKPLELQFKNVTCAAGILTFTEELSLISNLDVMLSMDSGNGHLAAMHGVPVITLWGVTHPFAGFTPFMQNSNNSLLADREKYPLIPTSIYGNKVVPGYENVMASIPVEDVIFKIEEIIK